MKPRAIMSEDVNAEILKRGRGGLDDNFNEGWSTCTLPLNCCTPSSTTALLVTRPTPSTPIEETTSEAASAKNTAATSPNSDIGIISPAMSSQGSNEKSLTAELETLEINHKEKKMDTAVADEKTKKPKPVKLMRTPSLVIKRRRGFGRSASSDTRRLDETLEELDDHLMGTTLKNIKFMNGPKFTIFNDIAFQRECLEAHNKVRQAFGCPTLSWSQELADEADTWAQTVAERGRVLYKELPGVGENISLLSANGSTHLPTGTELTELWASEFEKYNYAKPAWSEKCQHFTQLIWKRTTRFGVGRVWLQSKSVIAVVAFYAPTGNCNGINEFRDNVPAPMGGKTATAWINGLVNK